MMNDLYWTSTLWFDDKDSYRSNETKEKLSWSIRRENNRSKVNYLLFHPNDKQTGLNQGILSLSGCRWSPSLKCVNRQDIFST